MKKDNTMKKRYVLKPLKMWFLYGIYLDEQLLYWGGITRMTEICEMMNNVYSFSVSETVVKMGGGTKDFELIMENL